MRRRIQAGDRVRIVSETNDAIELESALRLRPGDSVDVVRDRMPSSASPPRAAYVMSWTVVRLGKEGPLYRGVCRWE